MRSRLAPVVVVNRNSQSGLALITALLIAALVSILAVALASRQQLDIRRTANILHGDQALLLARGMETWAAFLLARSPDQEVYKLLGQTLPPMAVPGGRVAGRLEDLQGLFNVNNLVLGKGDQRKQSSLQFRRLLAICRMPLDLEQTATDWLDPDQEPLFPGGAEDAEYLAGEPPFRTANRPLLSVSELRQVKGFHSEAYERCLRPLLCALPEATDLNVNTAPAPLLASLADGFGLDRAKLLVENRPPQGFATVADFLKQEELAGTGIQGQFLDVKSRFFMVESEATVGQGRVVLYSLLEKQGQRVLILRRSIGAF